MLLSRLRILVRWRRAWISLGASFLLGLGLLFLPQFDVLGFEAAFAVAVLMPVVAGALGAGFRRSGLPQDRPWVSLLVLLVASQVLVAVPLLLVAGNMIRAPICDPFERLLFFLLLPAFSAAMAAVVGWFRALCVRRSSVALLLWLLVFLGSLAVVAWRFYATPAVSFFGPFFGQYPGVLYDTLVPVSSRLLTYRVTNLLETGILLLAVAFGWDPALQRLCGWRLLRSRLAAFALPRPRARRRRLRLRSAARPPHGHGLHPSARTPRAESPATSGRRARSRPYLLLRGRPVPSTRSVASPDCGPAAAASTCWSPRRGREGRAHGRRPHLRRETVAARGLHPGRVFPPRAQARAGHVLLGDLCQGHSTCPRDGAASCPCPASSRAAPSLKLAGR